MPCPQIVVLDASKAQQLRFCKDSWAEACCHSCCSAGRMLVVRAQRCLLVACLIRCSGPETVLSLDHCKEQ